VAKVAVVGLTAVRADLERYLHHGWHANTWGGGKLSDNALSYATLDEFSHGRSDLFAGLSYAENLETKGHYLQEKLEGIRDRHPQTLCQFEGFGGMHGVTLRRRDEVIAEAWRRGLKLLGCGAPGDEARVRILLLADVLTKEIDDLAALLESAIEAVERDDRRNE
jgi:4-aminobutyrate aminotransferase-like enzyme